MSTIVKCEFDKLFKSLYFWIIVICVISLSALSIILLGTIGNKSTISGYNAFLIAVGDSGIICMFGSIFCGLFICNDFEYKIVQLEVEFGYKRLNIAAEKSIVCATITIILNTLYILIYTSGVTVLNGFGKNITNDIISKIIILLFLNILQVIAITSTYVFLCFTLQKVGSAISGNIIFAIGFGQVLLSFINKNNIVYKLNPFGELTRLATFNVKNSNIILPLIVAIVWSAVFLTGNIIIFNKKELK